MSSGLSLLGILVVLLVFLPFLVFFCWVSGRAMRHDCSPQSDGTGVFWVMGSFALCYVGAGLGLGFCVWFGSPLWVAW